MFNMFKIISLLLFINFVVLSTAQECDPRVVEWFPHQYSCQKFVICFHGNPIGLSQFKPKKFFFNCGFKTLQSFHARQDSTSVKLNWSALSRLKLDVTLTTYVPPSMMKQTLSSYQIGLIAKSNIEKSYPRHKILIFTKKNFQLFCVLQRKSDSTKLCWRALVGFQISLVYYWRLGYVWSENRK